MQPAVLLTLLAPILALDNGLGSTPPMAWSSWNCFALGATEDGVKGSAESLIETGLAAAGYKYINIDAGYLAGRNTTTNELIVNSQRYPSGIANLSATLHSMGLKLGVYTDLSGLTCGDGPNTGSKGHYEIDAQTFADWGADYLKVDFCGATGQAHDPGKDPRRISYDPVPQYEAWSQLRDAINKTGHPMYYSICPHSPSDNWASNKQWPLWYSPPREWTADQRHKLANSLLVEYSNTADTWLGGSEGGVMSNLDSMLHATNLEYSVPGSWNDADMLQVCNYGKGKTPGGGMTLIEYRSHYSAWAILASPLILGVDLRTIATEHPDCLEMLLNQDIIAVNQDPLGASPKFIYQIPTMTSNLTSAEVMVQVMARPLSNSRLAVLLLNRDASTRTLSATWAQLGLPVAASMSVYDVIAQKAAGSAAGTFSANVASHDVAFVILEASK